MKEIYRKECQIGVKKLEPLEVIFDAVLTILVSYWDCVVSSGYRGSSPTQKIWTGQPPEALLL